MDRPQASDQRFSKVSSNQCGHRLPPIRLRQLDRNSRFTLPPKASHPHVNVAVAGTQPLVARNATIATTTISAGYFESLYCDLESVAELRHTTYVELRQSIYICAESVRNAVKTPTGHFKAQFPRNGLSFTFKTMSRK